MKKILLGIVVFLISCSPLNATIVEPTTVAPYPVEPTLTATSTAFPVTKPDDFSVEYHWSAGSLPEPYDYRYIITIGPDLTGEILFIANDWVDPPIQWRETFLVSAAQFDQVYTQLRDIGALQGNWQPGEIPAGGSADSLEIIAYGQQIKIPAYIEDQGNARAIHEVYDDIEALVPEARWEKLNTLYEKYIAAYEAAELDR